MGGGAVDTAPDAVALSRRVQYRRECERPRVTNRQDAGNDLPEVVVEATAFSKPKADMLAASDIRA